MKKITLLLGISGIALFSSLAQAALYCPTVTALNTALQNGTIQKVTVEGIQYKLRVPVPQGGVFTRDYQGTIIPTLQGLQTHITCTYSVKSDKGINYVVFTSPDNTLKYAGISGIWFTPAKSSCIGSSCTFTEVVK